ncbi:hypothetical protein EW146_g2038 [Bondarzewia mesenterica]|uniref:Major facilitator superfamily (MFS) profile domain-containing protein n=1 Tax=Bondarzewia mesenterica TaxID=1095465 RepID=A0A4V3XFV7_9AGAM|nr:hypothetical protein EW146_g2038 [Bondarzewia mesenterica]
MILEASLESHPTSYSNIQRLTSPTPHTPPFEFPANSLRSMAQKVVLCGAGFLGTNIATAISKGNTSTNVLRRIQVSSRHPQSVHAKLAHHIPSDHLLPSVPVDVTKPETLPPAFEKADVVVSLVGILHGTPEQFEKIQWRGAENVARAAKGAGARLVHISAIGADKKSSIPYERTKALGEEAVFSVCPDATVVRPSVVFGPGDEFFARFASLSRVLPFMPVFDGGLTRFQPVYVGDLGRCVEVITRRDEEVRRKVEGKIIEAGGPDVFTYRQIIELVLEYTHRTRPIISLPWTVGRLQGAIMEYLPPNIFTLTRGQVNQLKHDNVVSSDLSPKHVSFKEILEQYSPPLTSILYLHMPSRPSLRWYGSQFRFDLSLVMSTTLGTAPKEQIDLPPCAPNLDSANVAEFLFRLAYVVIYEQFLQDLCMQRTQHLWPEQPSGGGRNFSHGSVTVGSGLSDKNSEPQKAINSHGHDAVEFGNGLSTLRNAHLFIRNSVGHVDRRKHSHLHTPFDLYFMSILQSVHSINHNTTSAVESPDFEAKLAEEQAKIAVDKPYSVFTPKEKWFIVIVASLAATFSPLTANIYLPAIPVIASQFHESIEKINLTVTIYMVMQGISPMFWGILADRWGRRPMFLGCMTVLSLSCVGLALVPTGDYWLLMVLRCVQAAGSASTVALGAGVIADIATRAERGGFFGLFSTGPMIGPCIGPVIGGGLAQGLGWRSIFWFLCISSAVNAMVMFLLFPETLRSIVGDGSILPPAFHRPIISIVGRNRQSTQSNIRPPPKPFSNPLLLFTYPDIVVLLIFNGILYAVFYGVTATISSLFEKDYPFLNQTDIGLCFLAIGGGMVFGSVFTGRFLDRDYAAIKNKMIKQAQSDPEKKIDVKDVTKDEYFPIEVARLRTMPVYVFAFVACIIGYGWCLQAKVSIAGPLILQIIIGYVIVSVMNTIQTLLVDLAPSQGSSITACNNLVRCSLGAALVAIINIILDALDPGWTYVLLGGICLASSPLLYIEIKWGPVWQTVRGITEFIEVAIHTILYVRQIYPADLFVRRKKYDTPVFQSRHPGLNEYISGAIRAVGEELVLGKVDKVVVVIKDKDDIALERFIFSIQNMIEVESYNKDTSVQDTISSATLGQYFRSFLVKLNMIEAQLGQLPPSEDNTFAIVLELRDGEAPSVGPANAKDDPPPWIPASTEHTTSGAADEAHLHMVRAVDTGIINLSLAVQESEEKLRALSETKPSKGKERERGG